MEVKNHDCVGKSMMTLEKRKDIKDFEIIGWVMILAIIFIFFLFIIIIKMVGG